MKQGWEIKKLGDICCKKQQIARAVKTYSPSDSIVYIDISAIDSSTNEITEPTTMLLKDAPSRAQQVVEKNDILVSLVRPNLKNIALICDDRNNLVASSGFCILRTKENPRFLKYIVIGEPFTNYLISRTSGANYPAVREDDVKGYSIPIPPLPEQEKIVAELDCLSGIIEKKKQQLKEYDALAQSIFYEIFGNPIDNEKGWEVKTLGDVCNFINGYAFKSQLFVEEGDKILRISNIQDGCVDITDAAHFDKKDYPKVDFKKYAVFPNDIVIALSGATTGKLGINKTGNTLYLNQRVAICREKNNDINHTYLLFYLMKQSASFLDTAAGVAQPNLSTEQMKTYLIGMPPLPIQQEFASKIEVIEKQKELIKQSIAETETLFNSRMDYYFN